MDRMTWTRAPSSFIEAFTALISSAWLLSCSFSRQSKQFRDCGVAQKAVLWRSLGPAPGHSGVQATLNPWPTFLHARQSVHYLDALRSGNGDSSETPYSFLDATATKVQRMHGLP